MPAIKKKTARKKKAIRKKSPQRKTATRKKLSKRKSSTRHKTIKKKKDYTRYAGGNTRGGDRKHNCRPTKYTPELADMVLSRMIEGESLTKMMQSSVDVPHRLTVYKWTIGELGAPSEFKLHYTRARQLQADAYAEKVLIVSEGLDETKRQNVELALADLPMDASQELINKTAFAAERRSIEGSRLLSDNFKWTSGRMHPKSWGDRHQITGVDEDDAPVKFDLGKLSTRQLEKIARLEKEVSGG